MHDDRLTLQGRREARVSCEQYHQVERGHGEFMRTFVLSQPVNTDGVDRRSGRRRADDHRAEAAGRSAAPRRRFLMQRSY